MMKSDGGDPAIRIAGLRVVRGKRTVIEDLTLDIPAGQVVGLLGPSGCGKTTLMRALVGVQQIAGGTVEVLGLPAGTAPLRHRVGYVTQDPSVYADLTIAENLRYFAAVVGTPRSGLGAEVARVLDLVDLADHADSTVQNLSGGQASRVSLAAALVGTPELLVLDEPTVGLDPVLRRDLWAIFRRLADSGVTLLVSSHVMDEAVRCDRLLLMRAGRMLADDTLDGVLAATGAPDVEQAFLALVDRAVDAADAAGEPARGRHAADGAAEVAEESR
ncbi:MAG: ABC transporter ATP-binding protein [Kineosporiaceae bacterium]|nr:ABC transporter ATP-binding protein [Kineosporiaceae bacterium]MBK8075739.1 ABC transporter ATP-binding protein [Kineosporiaceae bacterium]